jgi:hypothetical protein
MTAGLLFSEDKPYASRPCSGLSVTAAIYQIGAKKAAALLGGGILRRPW